jgi:hypothetical protein
MFFGNKSNADITEKNEPGVCVDDSGNVMNVLTHSIDEAINSKYHKEVRLAQLQNSRYEMCKTCWDREDANNRYHLPQNSVRIYKSFYQLHDVDGVIKLDDASALIKEDGSIDNTPISLDLRFTNVCNMKCIMCSPQYSKLQK